MSALRLDSALLTTRSCVAVYGDIALVGLGAFTVDFADRRLGCGVHAGSARRGSQTHEVDDNRNGFVDFTNVVALDEWCKSAGFRRRRIKRRHEFRFPAFRRAAAAGSEMEGATESSGSGCVGRAKA